MLPIFPKVIFSDNNVCRKKDSLSLQDIERKLSIILLKSVMKVNQMM